MKDKNRSTRQICPHCCSQHYRRFTSIQSEKKESGTIVNNNGNIRNTDINNPNNEIITSRTNIPIKYQHQFPKSLALKDKYWPKQNKNTKESIHKAPHDSHKLNIGDSSRPENEKTTEKDKKETSKKSKICKNSYSRKFKEC